jgi:hypothetical protein
VKQPPATAPQNNAYSNKRWCCGDNNLAHMDISKEAFAQVGATCRLPELLMMMQLSTDHWLIASHTTATQLLLMPWHLACDDIAPSTTPCLQSTLASSEHL